MEHSWYSLRAGKDGKSYPGICLNCSILGDDEAASKPCTGKVYVSPWLTPVHIPFFSSDWLPIETAPKNGTQVLICKQGEEWVIIAYWGDIYSAVDAWTTGRDDEYKPTHWMPLPKSLGGN